MEAIPAVIELYKAIKDDYPHIAFLYDGEFSFDTLAYFCRGKARLVVGRLLDVLVGPGTLAWRMDVAEALDAYFSVLYEPSCRNFAAEFSLWWDDNIAYASDEKHNEACHTWQGIEAIVRYLHPSTNVWWDQFLHYTSF